MKRILTGLAIVLLSACATSQSPAPSGLPTHLSGNDMPTPVPQSAPVPTTAPAPSAVAGIPKQTHDDIITLLQMTLSPHLGEVTKIMSTVYVSTLQAKYRDISPAVADEIRADIGKIISDPERVKALEESMVPLYARLYTDDEVRQILAFSKTPVGAKLFSGIPNEQQINEAIQPWAIGTIAPVMMMDTAQILKKHHITVNTDGSSSSP